MLGQHWDYHGLVFRPLALVDRGGVGGDQEFAKSVRDGPAGEAGVD
jgi:hypothetical protein